MRPQTLCFTGARDLGAKELGTVLGWLDIVSISSQVSPTLETLGVISLPRLTWSVGWSLSLSRLSSQIASLSEQGLHFSDPDHQLHFVPALAGQIDQVATARVSVVQIAFAARLESSLAALLGSVAWLTG